MTSLIINSYALGAALVAPGTVTLDPQPDGVHYTMPSLPAGAASMKLQKSVDAGANWYDVTTGLAGGATGTDATGLPIFTSQDITFSINNGGTGWGAVSYDAEMSILTGVGELPGGYNSTLSGDGMSEITAAFQGVNPGWYWFQVGDQLEVLASDPAPGSGLVIEVATATATTFSSWAGAVGFGGSAVRYRAVNNTGQEGASSNTTTTAIPATPSGLTSLTYVDGSFGFDVGAPALSARALTLEAYISEEGDNTPQNALGEASPSATTGFTGVGGGFEAYVCVRGVNIYGESGNGASTQIWLLNAPGVVIFTGSPNGYGIPWELPALPTYAGSLILQCSDDDATWTNIATGQAGEAAGTLEVAPDGEIGRAHV